MKVVNKTSGPYAGVDYFSRVQSTVDITEADAKIGYVKEIKVSDPANGASKPRYTLLCIARSTRSKRNTKLLLTAICDTTRYSTINIIQN